MENFIWFLLIALFISQIHLVAKVFYRKGISNRFILYLLKSIYFIGTIFSNINVLYHELGHVIGAVITRGKVYKVELNSNRGGVAQTGSSSFFGKAFTTFSGYPFASLVSLLFVNLLINEYYNYIIYILVATLIGSMLFLVRNVYGFVWCGVFLALTLGIDNYLNDYVVYFVSFITAIIVINSITTAITIFYLSFNKEVESDALNLSKITKIPSVFWGLCFLAISSYVGYLNYLLLIGSQLF